MPRPLICWQWEPAASMRGCGKRGPGSGTSGRCLCLSKGVREQLLEDSWYCSMQVCWQRGDRQSDLVLPRLPKEPATVCKDALRSTWAAQVWEAGLCYELEGKEGVMASFPVSSCYLMQKKGDSSPAHTTHNTETDPAVILGCRVMILTF